ncbi:hypothetical protein PR202_ga08246 [Eleusine coracana subsp. coracana]|uniref:Uncharacterized protein n=1 Tax=Eleusine coracana subsp. coracana TaxID=191504 RepID=A0AAV5BZJ0_ELECO|nr:hypothetical protein PR202_ga08246 [Eleusine coracana subsp. coracana]
MASRGDEFVGPFTFDCEYPGYTRCSITKAGIGGPLLRFSGEFVGMNFFDEVVVVGTPYLWWSEILPVLDNFKTKRFI